MYDNNRNSAEHLWAKAGLHSWEGVAFGEKRDTSEGMDCWDQPVLEFLIWMSGLEMVGMYL